jgi:MFS family permease
MSSAAPSPLRRDLRSIVGDGIAFSLMVGVGETYLPAFVLAAGLGEISAGLVATLPMLVGASLQLVSPAAVRRLGSHRRWVVWSARLQAASFAPLVAGALAGGIDRLWVFVAAAAYWGFGMATGPAWNTWVSTLVPERRRARFFARRNRWCQAALLVGVLAGGALLEGGPRLGDRLRVFALLFAAAAAARVASSFFLASQSEPEPLPRGQRDLRPREFLARLGPAHDGQLLVYLLGMQVAVHLAAPFFTPFLLGPLELSYASFTLYTAVALVARVVALPWLGQLAHRFGARSVLWLGALGIVPLPCLWLVSSEPLFFVALQAAAGVAWAALELGTLLAFFEDIERHERTSVLTYFNLANALAIATGTLLGAALFAELGPERGYAALFVLSAAGRALCLLLVRRVPPPERPAPSLELRTLAVRPNAGALQRPILATLDADPEEPAPLSAGGPRGSSS